MDALTWVYLIYIFIGLYFLFLAFLNYFPNKKYLFDIPKVTREYSLSIVIPCYNDEEVIEKTVMAVLASDYRNLKKVIVVDTQIGERGAQGVVDADSEQQKIPQRVKQVPEDPGEVGEADLGLAIQDSLQPTHLCATSILGQLNEDVFQGRPGNLHMHQPTLRGQPADDFENTPFVGL